MTQAECSLVEIWAWVQAGAGEATARIIAFGNCRWSEAIEALDGKMRYHHHDGSVLTHRSDGWLIS